MADSARNVAPAARTAYVRPADLAYAVDEVPPPLRLALIGLQYAVMTAIYLIIAAIILRHARVGEAESVAAMGIACVVLAIGTALQALPYGPVGSGFLAPPVFSATYLGPSVLAAEEGGMRLVLGMTLFGGIVELLVGFGIRRLRLIVTPVLSGLTVFVVGLQLGVVGIGEFLDVRHAALLAFHRHLTVTVLTLSTCIALSIWGRGTMKLLCSLIGLPAGIAAGWVLGLVTAAELAGAARLAWVLEWKVARDVAETAVAQAQAVLGYIRDENSGPPDGILSASYNGIELRIDIAYDGPHAPAALPSGERAPPEAGDLDNEEAAACAGLCDFLTSLAADRRLVRRHRGRFLVRLSYTV